MAVLLYQSSQKPVSHPITRLLITTLAFFKQLKIVEKKKEKKNSWQKVKGYNSRFQGFISHQW